MGSNPNRLDRELTIAMFERVWLDQLEYNLSVKTGYPNMSKEEWAQHYLLGLVSEIDEVLREIGWKKHRPDRLRDPRQSELNLREELADITKYVLCLWQLYVDDPLLMLDSVDRKNRKLAHRSRMEASAPATGQPVLVCDLDGSLSNWIASWHRFLRREGSEAGQATMFMEVETGLSYEQYVVHKHEFELMGGYESMLAYPDASELIESAQRLGFYLVVCTARPYPLYRRIWDDTMAWLERNRIVPDQLHLVSDQRIAIADRFRRHGHPTILVDDDPQNAKRAAANGIPVLMRAHAYNQDCEHVSHIYRVDSWRGIDRLLKTLGKKGGLA